MADPYDLERLVAAQQAAFASVLGRVFGAELDASTEALLAEQA
jgi:uncharacterized protein (DUF1810 family)